MERTATLDELEERVKQLEPTKPKRDENIYLQTRQVKALERSADALEQFAECISRYGWSDDPKIRVDTGERR
jgi:predicted nuclease with TOPRIM domain